MITLWFSLFTFCILLGHTEATHFEISLSSGYGFPLGREYVGASYHANDTGNFTFYEDKVASLGNGLKGDLSTTLYLSNTLGIVGCIGFSSMGGYALKNSIGEKCFTEEFTTHHMSISLGLKIQSSYGKLSPYLYVAPAIVFPFSINIVLVDKSPPKETIYYDGSWEMAPGFGFQSGVGVTLFLHSHFALFFECTPLYLKARIKEQHLSYEEEGVRYNETIVFLRDRTILPNDIQQGNSLTVYEHGEFLQSLSSFALKLGCSFSLKKR